MFTTETAFGLAEDAEESEVSLAPPTPVDASSAWIMQCLDAPPGSAMPRTFRAAPTDLESLRVLSEGRWPLRGSKD